MNREQQKNELFRVIWKIANEQRGAIDSWDFKQYILGTLFFRFISENLTSYIKSIGEPNFQNLSDKSVENGKDEIIKEKGFFIYPSQLFCNVIKNLDDPTYVSHLNENVAKIFKSIESSAIGTASENDIKGLFDDYDVNSTKIGATVAERNQRLTKLLRAINGLNLGNFNKNHIDLFGDAYEYLMNMYAAGAGKSGGEFFTPQEVSSLLAHIAIGNKKSVNKVYDPCCGSGGLLLKFAKILGKENVYKGFYGQEINPTTFNLCRINMFLHDINYEQFDIVRGNTLLNPYHKDDEPFEVIVSNPPYSITWEGDSNPLLINDERFSPAGVLAPKSKADLAFVMHCLSWLSTNGTAAIVEFPGVLYRGGAEQKIRKYLIDNNFIDTVIQLPANLFYGTSIATCIIVLKKSKTESKTLFVDASKEFVPETNSNRLSEENISHILKWINDKKDMEHICSYVDNKTIADNDYNLSVSSYVEVENTKEVIDIKVLNQQIKTTVLKVNQLRNDIDDIIKEIEK